MLEQQTFRNRRSGGDAPCGRAGKAVSGETSPGGAQDELPPQVAGHAKSAHLVSKHSPSRKVKEIAAAQYYRR
jgi:hypothetical protein